MTALGSPGSAGPTNPATPTGPTGDEGRSRSARADRLLTASLDLALLTVVAEIAYPLTPDRELSRLSVLTVLLFTAASLTHAVATRGPAWTARLALVFGGGAFVAEVVGVATGLPFGRYSYAHTLGPLVLGVPLLIPLAWLMMAYPVRLMAHSLTTQLVAPQRVRVQRLVRPVIGGAALAAWDIFLDPQMVAAGHWVWADPSPGLPGVSGVPLTNLAGWLLAATALMALADAALPDAVPAPVEPGDRAIARPPAVLLGWTWAGGVIGNVFFFHRPWVALWGGLALGLFVVPALCRPPSRWPR